MNEKFAANLRRLRERRGLSRRTLSELCGLSRNMVTRYERGEAIPSAEAICQLADYFEVSVDDLLDREKKF